jgi:hypothetical protein
MKKTEVENLVTLSLFNGFENINTISFTVQYLTLQAMGFYPSSYVAFFILPYGLIERTRTALIPM